MSKEDISEFVKEAVIVGRDVIPICRDFKLAYDAVKNAKAFVENRKTQRLLKALADFSKYKILDLDIKKKIEEISPDEWESISLKVIEVLEESGEEEKTRLTRQLVLARLNNDIDSKSFNALAKALKELPLSILCNFNSFDKDAMERLVSYNLANRKLEVQGTEVVFRYNWYRTFHSDLLKITQMAEEEKENTSMQTAMKID